MSDQDTPLRELVAEVAAAYFSNSHVVATEIPTIIGQIAASLRAVDELDGQAGTGAGAAEPQARATSAQIRKSITPDALISFEDGKGYKTLKRHLTTRGLSLEAYREKWGLPKDYPSVALSYSAARSAMALKIGLGSKGRARRAKR